MQTIQMHSRGATGAILALLTLLSLTACSDDGELIDTDQTSATAETSGDNAVESDTAPMTGSTAGVLCDYTDVTYNASASIQAESTSTWSCTDSERVLAANGIPDHDVGTFPNPANPNTISEQPASVAYTLSPATSDTPTELGGPRGAVGYVLNGIKMDPGTAGSCDDSGTNCSLVDPSGGWSIEALGQDSFDFGEDFNNAHVQPTGEYHYHGIPEGFIDKLGGDNTGMTLIAWAADGFPIYARYGYADPDDAGSAVTAMQGSYQLVSTVASNRPSVELYALGTFSRDWEYVAGSGDLDECNGRTGVTPEFPDGIYHYFATDSYPYMQRCVTGEIDEAAAPQGLPQGPPPAQS